MAGFRETKRRRRSNTADNLSDDALVEILSRVPYKSLCRFKCVSRRWRDIISHPDHRKELPQYHLGGLAGFIQSRNYTCFTELDEPSHRYSSFSPGTRPSESLSILPNQLILSVLDSCNGLLLCSCFENLEFNSFNYVVCNLATEKWLVLPGSFKKLLPARLGYEPAVSSHFHVFQFNKVWAPDINYEDQNIDYMYLDARFEHIKGVNTYSSKTGVWRHIDNCLSTSFSIVRDRKSVYVNGLLYLVVIAAALVTVDVESSTWKMIPMPGIDATNPYMVIKSIDLSQGSLHLAYTTTHNYWDTLSISVLEDCGSSQRWILKYSINSYVGLFGGLTRPEYSIVAMHPERDTIYLVYGKQKVLISYDMDSKQVCFIENLSPDSMAPYHPYAPLYTESVDGHWQSDSKSRPSVSPAI